jgi:hypothetical protein
VTGDESWILQEDDHQQIWYVSADEIPTKVRQVMVTSKTMLTMLLSIHGAIFINYLPSDENFNNSCFCQMILESLDQILHNGRAAHSPRPKVHFDQADTVNQPGLRIVSRASNSIMFLNIPTALNSVHATSFDSVI